MKKAGIILIVLWILIPQTVYAVDETEQIQKELFEQFDFDEIDRFLEESFPNQKVSFGEMIQKLISGETQISFEFLKEFILNQFFYEFHNSKESIVHILMIVIIAAIFRNFSEMFQNGQVSELSFYVLYMMLITICLNSFHVLTDSVLQGVERLLAFLQLLGPVYFLAVAIATGSLTSVAFYNILLFLIYVVEMLILNILLPLLQIYMVMRFLDELSIESYLSRFADLLQTLIVWSMRTILAGVVGFNMIQGLISPALDSVKRSVLTKGGESIPIIGDAIGGATEVFFGTAVLMKNGIGATGAILCLGISLAPMIQMAVVVLMYKLIAALVQPISEKRIVNCISSMSDGAVLLLRMIVTSCALFLITIAMVATTTS